MNARVLVAEDDPKQAHLIRTYLERDGHDVLVVTDGRRAIDESRGRAPDLLVLDIMMPKLDGMDVCRVLRSESQVPILVLTARADEDTLLQGLQLGADDYMTKPFSPRELAARVRALLRRSRPESGPPTVFQVGRLTVDTGRVRVDVAGDPVSVTAREFAVLAALAAEPGRVFSRLDIVHRAFGFDSHVSPRTVDAHIANLRRKIEPDPAHPLQLLTVYGHGYTLAVD